jgi:hypothetical protein
LEGNQVYGLGPGAQYQIKELELEKQAILHERAKETKKRRGEMSKDELTQADTQLFSSLRRQYILLLKERLIEPNDFCKEEGSLSDAHYCTLRMNYQILERDYENHCKIETVKPVQEEPSVTL